MKKARTALVLASVLILVGLVLNRWTVAYLFSADNHIESTVVRVIIWFFDICFVLLGFLLFKFHERLRFPTKKEFLLLLFGLIVGLILLEGGGRIWLGNFASDATFASFATYNMIQQRKHRYTQHPYLSWYPTPNYVNQEGDKHNSLGFRGEEVKNPKPKDQFRIVTIGGSTTYTTGVKSYKNSYPYLLQQELNNRGHETVRVINAGVGNYDSWNNLINFEFKVLDLNPDLLIVYMGDNDVETRLVYPFDAYRADNTGRIKAPSLPTINPWDRSVVVRMVMVPLGLSKSYGYLSSLNSAPTYVYGDCIRQKKRGTYPSGLFRKHSALDILEHNPPVYTKRNVKNIVAIAKEYDINVLLASFAFSPLSIETSSEFYKRAISENNNVIKQIADSYGLPFFDFAKAMPSNKKFWVKRGVHVNKKGARIKAHLFTDYIEHNGLIRN